MRTFIAIEMPEEITAALAALQNDLRRANADVGWTRPENIHLTLKFLGETEERQANEIAQALTTVAAEYQPFTLVINTTGVFPNARQPRVLWIGLAGEIEALTAMQKRLETALAAIRVRGDEKAFHPHLTIGRVKSKRNVRELIARADVYSLRAMSFEVREIVLMKSELHPAGSRYTPLAKAALGQ
jgi:2'-5' RNA ligase